MDVDFRPLLASLLFLLRSTLNMLTDIITCQGDGVVFDVHTHTDDHLMTTVY